MISVTVNSDFNFPAFINDIFDKMDNETKSAMVKNVIMSHVEKKEESGFEISELAQSLTNRVKFLPDIDSVSDMLSILTYIYPYWLTNKL